MRQFMHQHMHKIFLILLFASFLCMGAGGVSAGATSHMPDAQMPNAKTPEPRKWSFAELNQLPVQSGGRIKPLDSFARETVLFETGSRTFQGWNPTELLLSWATHPHEWEKQAFIKVSRKDVKRLLGMDENRTLFSPEELLNNPVLMMRVERLSNTRPIGTEPPGSVSQSDPREKELKSLIDRIALFQGLVMGDAWKLIPRPEPEAWGSLLDAEKGAPSEKIGLDFLYLLKAYQTPDPVEFEKLAIDLRQRVEKEIPGYQNHLSKQVTAEVLYNRIRPFLYAWIFYLSAALLWVIASLKSDQKALGQRIVKGLAASFTVGGIISHVFGFGLRCYVAGRPPVTNMYESVIWVSLGVVFFALILYSIHRQRVLLAVATALAGFGLISGDAAPAILDPSLHPLVPVLRSNYWLTVHVLTITLGYAAFALTFGLSHIALVQFLRNAKAQVTSSLNQLTYRSMQFGVVLIAAGTILGGIWADYSWGRFWGWDPKEVWALITLLCYLTILHGRYAGWVSSFGFAVWSALSFLSVIMAWYGVNFILGVGLHSYGFSTGGTPWILGFVALELLFVGYVVLRKKAYLARA